MLSFMQVGCLLVGLLVVWKILQIGKRDRRMPPGPPTIPILGNAHLIPKKGLANKFQEWAKEYGPVYSLTVGPSNIIVISDRRAVDTLFNKRGNLYSDRPRADVAMWVTDQNHISFEQNSKGWKEKRAIVTRFFSPKLLDEHHFRVQEAEATCFMFNVFEHPEKLFDYTKLYTLSVIISLLYGQRVKDLDSFWYKDFYHHMEQWGDVLEPGANPPVEQFPLLWQFPGSWKERAKNVKSERHRLWTKARQVVDARRSRGDKRDCLLDTKLDDFELRGWPFEEWVVNYLFGEMVEAGAESTANQLLTLIQALALNPHIQSKARLELDAVCGADRAPTFSDFEKCPYINCIVKEGMRWRPTARSGLPHMVAKGEFNFMTFQVHTNIMADDYYDGYLIPKESTVFMATWAMHQNGDLYTNPDSFNPDRYSKHTKLAHEYAISPEYEDRDHYGYGSGRRMCPGIHLAERNMWRMTAKLIWAFDIQENREHPLDSTAYTSSVLASPMPFHVKVSPRSEEHMSAVKNELGGALGFLAQYE